MEITIPEELAHLKDDFERFDKMDNAYMSRTLAFSRNVGLACEYLENNPDTDYREELTNFIVEYARKMVESFARLEKLSFDDCAQYVMVMSDVDSISGLLERHPHLGKVREDFLVHLRSEYAKGVEKFKNKTLI